MANLFPLKLRNLRALCFVHTFLALGIITNANAISWKQRSEKYLVINFNRTKLKTNSYIEQKYKIASDNFQLYDQLSQIRLSGNEYFESCKKRKDKKNCERGQIEFNRRIHDFSQSVRLSINNTPKKNKFNFFKREALLLNLLTISQQKATSPSRAIDISLSLDSSFLAYFQTLLPKESFNHLNNYLSSFENSSINIKNISQHNLDKLTSTMNYFIRKERETTNLSSSLRKNLELINLFWNNVLKIKKDQR